MYQGEGTVVAELTLDVVSPSQEGEGTVIAELTLDVVSPSQVTADAEVLTEVHVTFALQV